MKELGLKRWVRTRELITTKVYLSCCLCFLICCYLLMILSK
jgi:hypothetical protein